MKDFLDLSKWLLEKDIRAKNATSFLAALFSVVVIYFTSRDRAWFEGIERHGATAVGAALVIVFLIAFLSVWLAYSGIAATCQHVLGTRRARREADKRQRMIRDTLETLTDWQRRFLLRFIVEDRMQIPEFEVGQYKATWDFEMAVLVEKRVVREHRHAGVFEIEPAYREYLLAHWNPQSGILE